MPDWVPERMTLCCQLAGTIPPWVVPQKMVTAGALLPMAVIWPLSVAVAEVTEVAGWLIAVAPPTGISDVASRRILSK